MTTDEGNKHGPALASDLKRNEDEELFQMVADELSQAQDLDLERELEAGQAIEREREASAKRSGAKSGKFLGRFFQKKTKEPSPGTAAPETRFVHDDEQEIAPLPPMSDEETLIELIPIHAPFAFVRLLFHERLNTYRYEVIEPPLTERERATYAFVKDAFIRSLDVDLESLDSKGAAAYLAEQYEHIARRHELRLSPVARARVGYYLERDFIGFGAIDVLMQDPGIEDISCDGPRLPIYIHHRKYGSTRTDLIIPDDAALDGFVMHLVQRSGKHISVAEPLIDATLPDGSRLQATLSREITTRGSTFTIRKFRADPLTPPDLLQYESMTPEMMAYLWLAVEHGASALVCGGTASGKTTTLNALSLFIPQQKKIVSIEDTRELNLVHENWIPGVTRSGSMGSAVVAGRRVGEVDMFDLLKAALRQRPEYLIMGEVRGAEAYVLFQAMATGHTVYGTMHADSVDSAVHRLESKPIEIPRTLLTALDIVTIQTEVRIGKRRVRKMREVVEMTGIDPQTGELLTNHVFEWDPTSHTFNKLSASYVLRKIAEEIHLSEGEIHDELHRRAHFLSLMTARGIRSISDVTRHVARYTVNPEEALIEMEAEPPVT